MKLTCYGNIHKSFHYTWFVSSYLSFAGSEHSSEFPSATIRVSPPTQRLCNLARPVIRQHSDELMTSLSGERKIMRWGRHETKSGVACLCDRGGDLVCDRMENFPHATVTGSHLVGDLARCFAGVMLANACYGGIHALAWNGPFRTTAEGSLWRISAVGLGVPFAMAPLLAAIYFVAAFVATLVNPTWRPEDDADQAGEQPADPPVAYNLHHFAMTAILLGDRLNESIQSRRLRAILFAVAFLAYVLWCIALGAAFAALMSAFSYSIFIGRPFVLVECFLALPYSPAAVYLTPNWTSYWPHFS